MSFLILELGRRCEGCTRVEQTQLLRSRIRRIKPRMAIGLAVLFFFIAVAIFGPVLVHTAPSAMSRAVLQGPSLSHPLGTTQTGQSVLAEVVYGTSTTLIVGFGAALVATALAIVVGLVAGSLGGWTDEVLSTVSNIFLVIPALPLVIVLAAYLPSKGDLTVAAVIAATGWAWGARVIRAQTLSIRRRDFVEAARAAGESRIRIVFWEILPNEWAIIGSSFLFTSLAAILTQASLAFLGIGNLSTWSWGSILYWAENSSALQLGAWWWFVPPGVCIALVGGALAMINFGLDELINPRLRQAGIGTKRKRRVRSGIAAEPLAGRLVSAARGREVVEVVAAVGGRAGASRVS
jgi:ABC-type dipeptide/oligopeptide/nickel transport system permease subunit